MADFKLKLDEDLDFFEIEMASEGPIEMTPEIEEQNAKFMTEVFEPQVLRTVGICSCRQMEFMQRNMRRAQLMGKRPDEIIPTLEQEDVDALKYGTVILSKNGIHVGVSAIVRECRKCHKIEYWGSAEIFSRLIAEITTNYVSHTTADDQTESEPNVENLEDASGMFGEGTFLETIKETENGGP